MCGDKSQLLNLKMKKGGSVTIGDNKTLPILRKGTIGNSIISIERVQYVQGLKYNLILISQLYDDGYFVDFGKERCIINVGTNKVLLVARREGNIYILDFEMQGTSYYLDVVD